MSGGLDFLTLKGNKGIRENIFKYDSLSCSESIQVQFMHQGAAVICGSNTGEVSIWQIESGEKFQILDHGGKSSFILFFLPISSFSKVTACEPLQYAPFNEIVLRIDLEIRRYFGIEGIAMLRQGRETNPKIVISRFGGRSYVSLLMFPNGHY
jgi:hypothetical protein